ncbi:MAG: prolyl oligopeptidase family serine peptidase, partial [Litorilinea sp.]
MASPTTAPRMAPFGAWQSPILPGDVAARSIRFGGIVLDGDDIYWSEMRPNEGGRYVVVRRRVSGEVQDCTPREFNARTRVHEYGGEAFTVWDGVIYFVNFQDQRLYRHAVGETPEALTAPGLRYADFCIDHKWARLIAVREDHRPADGASQDAENQTAEPQNTVVAIPLAGGEDVILAQGHDFYSTPRLDPTGTHLAWLAWNHPDMPWTATELWSGKLSESGTLVDARRLTGGEQDAIFQPTWSPTGQLYFVSDRSGWWNLYRWENGKSATVLPMQAEFGRPQWVFGVPTYGFADADQLICSYTQDGVWYLGELEAATGALRIYELGYTNISTVTVTPEKAVFFAGGPREPALLAAMDLDTGALTVLRRSSDQEIDPACFAEPQTITYPTTDGNKGHAFYYPPTNAHFTGPKGEKPPLLVISHGGPTGATTNVYDPAVQYWTSRGIAVVDVNYGGSTGYGRAYRERLNDNWGIVDLDDCAGAAQYLVGQGLADGDRLAIRGGSAGGYTTLAMLAFRDLFRVGASYYGVSDLAALAEETHKFESRYLDGLVGSYPTRKDLYAARSPLHAVENLSSPLIFFQGDEDAIVPPNHAEMMVDAQRAKGVPDAYLLFEGEHH